MLTDDLMKEDFNYLYPPPELFQLSPRPSPPAHPFPTTPSPGGASGVRWTERGNSRCGEKYQAGAPQRSRVWTGPPMRWQQGSPLQQPSATSAVRRICFLN